MPMNDPVQGGRRPLTARAPYWAGWSSLLIGWPLLVCGLVFDVGALNLIGVVLTAGGVSIVVGRSTFERLRPKS
jgi:hypothetical protein